jgi:hypothetical protein
VPANYQPAVAPLFPYPADYASRSSATDPNYTLYGTNTVLLPLNNSSTPYAIDITPYGNGGLSGSPISPFINQPILSTNRWTQDASMFKTFALKERVRLRMQFDFFNVFNVPGNAYNAGGDGIVSTFSNLNTPRTMQASARLTW